MTIDPYGIQMKQKWLAKTFILVSIEITFGPHGLRKYVSFTRVSLDHFFVAYLPLLR